MQFKFVDLETLYARDSQLKKEDIQVLQEWLKKQPHLPEIKELQLLGFLHSCYYRIEPTKVAIDSYFTVKTHCTDILAPLSKEELTKAMNVAFMNVLPERTPDDYVVMLFKLTDPKTENFNFINLIRAINMICTLHLHQHGYENGAVVVFDMKGFTLAHLTRFNLTALKKALYHLQEGAPVRLKSIHFINVVSFVDKIISMAKPLLKAELYNMINFHTPNDGLYSYVPKKILPEEYGGSASSIKSLNEKYIKNIHENFDFYAWHETQKVDESKRFGKPKSANTIFGVEGTFKKLDID